ncbi:2221_t:CDS:2, partial [Scutellospora calospora]
NMMENMMEITETDTRQTNLNDTVTNLNHQLNELLQQQQKDNDYREEMHDQYQKLQSDYELLMLTMKTLKTRAELSEREVDSLKANLIKTEDHLQSESEKHRSTKDELIKTKTNLQSVKSQAMHDIRKREIEYTRFKEKMQKLLSDKYHPTCGPQGVNPPRKKAMKNTSYVTSPTGHDIGVPMVSGGFYAENSEKIKQGDGDADARDKDLLQENTKLRKLLFEVHNQVVSFIDSQASVDPELANLKTPESYNSRAANIQLPFELFAQNLEQEVKDILLALKFELNNRSVGVFENFQQNDVEIRRKDVEIRQKDVEIRQKDVEIRKQDDEIRQKYDEIRQKDAEILQKDAEIRQKDYEIRQKYD